MLISLQRIFMVCRNDNNMWWIPERFDKVKSFQFGKVYIQEDKIYFFLLSVCP